ncbi:MAG: DUF2207 domain-containing protein [Tannerellaceae bacterium]|nr:DUF2207 domain-containing protein [Tannerellaceae bacterium]
MIYIGVVLGFLFIAAVYLYNKLVKSRNRMQEAWSIMDVFLKKRHDLIPNLVDIVKGYAIHERTTLENVTRYRYEAMQAGDRQTQIASETGLGELLGRLLVSVEQYPQLTANERFLKLQQQITEMEHELEMARRYYNGTVRENNICRESFPSNIIAGMFRFPKGVFFKSFLSLLFLALSSLTLWANEAERVQRFHADIRVDTTGRIEVSESIVVYAAGDAIQRGIVRVMPLYRTDKDGKKHTMNIGLLSVQCNDRDEPYSAQTEGNDLAIYIGNRDVYLTPGVYTYRITYESDGHIGFFDDYDELYWNVTGHEWAFAIDEASATIRLPGGASPVHAACYTGPAGSTQSNCMAEEAANGLTLRTKGRLAPREGFTVAVSFPRDTIKRPPPPTRLQAFWETYRKIICSTALFVLMGCFYFFTWRKVGKDPEKPVVIPTFKPPHQWSPGVVGYLFRRRYDSRVFTSVLVSMAVKGAIRIVSESKKYTLEAVDKGKALSKEEESVWKTLFSSAASVTVSDKNHTLFAATTSRLKGILNTDWRIKDYYLKNIGYIALGACLCVLSSVLYLTLTGTLLDAGDLVLSWPFLIIGVFLVFSSVKQGTVTNILFLIVGLIMLVPTLASQFSLLFYKEPFAVGFFLLMLASFGVYVYLIKAPTVLGAQTQSELEGFRLYLKTAEENRLNLLTPPDRTPELFEQLLPYAIALNVENEWGKKFDNVLKQVDYKPGWYSSNQPFSAGSTFGHVLGNSFHSSIDRARISPASSSPGSSGPGRWSSGSRGGGFSGGGGGGGGGRGW